MAKIALAPIVLNDAIITIGTDDYGHHIGEFRLTPASQTLVFRGIGKGAVTKRQTTPDWTVNVGYAQDFETAQALALRLYEHHGEIVTITAKLASDDTKQWTVDVILVAGEVGGTADALLQSTVTLGVDGQPSFGTAA